MEEPTNATERDAETGREVELPSETDAEVAVEETLTGPPVDLPAEVEPPKVFATITGRAVVQRQPIVPAWARSKQDLKAAARYVAGQAGYRVAFQASRTPMYVGRALRWAPVGGGRLIAKGWRWTWDMETTPARRNALASGNVDEYERLVARRKDNIKSRLPLAGGALVATAGGGAAAWLTLPWWAQVPLWGGVLFGLARAGRPVDKPLVGPSVQVTRYERLTAEKVREALCAIGVAGLKDPKKITFPAQIHRDGPGQLARCNLPIGVEAVDVCEKRGKLSSALRLPIDQVWPTAGPDHAGQLDLWVGFQPASKMKPPKWSIAADGARTSVFEAADFGADQRQRAVAAPLFARNWLIGGMPGSGKSYAARALALVAALDPYVEFKIAEYKGTGDFTDFYDAGLCSTYVCGVDDEAIEEGERIVDWALAEAERRGKLIKKFRAEGRAPEGKVTPDLAAAGVGLHPVVVLLDEVHELFGASKEAADKAERAIKRGRALGIIFILATQIPDKDSLPPGITRCVNMRWCLAVQDHIANDMILGTGSYKRGITGTSFRPEIDAGWGMVTGLAAPTAVRSQYPDEKTTKKILGRAIQLRGGRPAWADDEEMPRVDVLVDVMQVWPTGRDRAQWQQLADALARFRPEAYDDLTGDSLSALLRGMGVSTLNVKAAGAVLKGCLLAEVQAAAERREVTRG
ncbi:FtsK/SpoIIIE domain-containing protein [Nonomuraea sp. NPDC004580]|uniref:FtsK/SpoIIIE domain-containing protein n=1 Tax=Nonomuraea sp. NPDC004580 TaxID=3154552 RepID=UPI0033A52418